MSGKRARQRRREQAMQRFIEDSKAIYLANMKIPGQVFASAVHWRESEGTLYAEVLAGSTPIHASGTSRQHVYGRVVSLLMADLQVRGYQVVHVSSEILRQLPKDSVYDASSILGSPEPTGTAGPIVVVSEATVTGTTNAPVLEDVL